MSLCKHLLVGFTVSLVSDQRSKSHLICASVNISEPLLIVLVATKLRFGFSGLWVLNAKILEK